MDNEVEKILADIRERVLAEERKAPAATPASVAPDLPRNGEQTANADTSESLRLLNSHLTTTARAWDRLPPVISQRSGALARLELWVKGHLKRATRWYAWEQINFNAAVHHALRDAVQVLSHHERSLTELARQRAELETQRQALLELSKLLTQTSDTVRDVTAQLRDEQLVCFKQLSLEATEAAVMDDRTRRKCEAELEELRQRIAKLENRP